MSSSLHARYSRLAISWLVLVSRVLLVLRRIISLSGSSAFPLVMGTSSGGPSNLPHRTARTLTSRFVWRRHKQCHTASAERLRDTWHVAYARSSTGVVLFWVAPFFGSRHFSPSGSNLLSTWVFWQNRRTCIGIRPTVLYYLYSSTRN